MALRNLGIEHEVVAIAEIDKFAIKSYEAIHGVTNNLGDISKIKTEDIPDHDLFTYSFPCQDISVAGKGLGLDEGSDTRSGLLWECQKVIAVKKPKYLLLENVKNLVGKKHKPNFDKWLEWLEGQGYTNYWEVLNAKDYGVPQNRERVFVVSILGHHEPYEFPEPVELERRLKDVLESEVDEKFYLSQERIDKLIINIEKIDLHSDELKVYHDSGINPTIVDNDYKGPNQILQIGMLDKPTRDNPSDYRVYNQEGVAPTLTTRISGSQVPHIPIKNATKRISKPEIKQVAQYDTPTRKNSNRFRTYAPDGIAPTISTMGGGGLEPHVVDLPAIAASRGRNPENPSDRTVGSPTEQRLEINKQGTSNTITTVQKDNYVVEPLGTLAAHNSDKFGAGYMDGVSKTLKANKHDISVVYNNYRIRKLTPKECWRLMGCSDEDFHKAEEVNSNSQLYKQAGNAIVVDVLEGIFSKLFGGSK